MLLTKDTIQDGVKKDDFYRFIANNHFEKASHGIYISHETILMPLISPNEQTEAATKCKTILSQPLFYLSECPSV